MADLKRIYVAVDEDTTLRELERFDEICGEKYQKIADNWRDKWGHLSTYFKYPQMVRTLIYTTNTIEGFNRQLRKVTKNKGVFPTDDSLFKMLYLAMMDITKSGQDAAATGAKSILSRRYSSLIESAIDNC